VTNSAGFESIDPLHHGVKGFLDLAVNVLRVVVVFVVFFAVEVFVVVSSCFCLVLLLLCIIYSFVRHDNIVISVACLFMVC
jgi:hypothetical protein